MYNDGNRAAHIFPKKFRRIDPDAEDFLFPNRACNEQQDQKKRLDEHANRYERKIVNDAVVVEQGDDEADDEDDKLNGC